MSHGCVVCKHLKDWDGGIYNGYGCWLDNRGLYDHEIRVDRAPQWCPLQTRTKKWITERLEGKRVG